MYDLNWVDNLYKHCVCVASIVCCKATWPSWRVRLCSQEKFEILYSLSCVFQYSETYLSNFFGQTLMLESVQKYSFFVLDHNSQNSKHK